MSSPNNASPPPRRFARTALLAALAPAAMFAAAFAAAPLYGLFCRVTGFGGTTQVAAAAPSAVLERRMEVRFDSNLAPGLPLRFTPQERRTSVRLGETKLAFYALENLSDRPVTVVASYNVVPFKTGIYFHKLQCFCFQDLTLKPGERMELPVVFYVSPELASDVDTEEVNSVTLSYTFFEAVPGVREKLALAGLGGGGDAR